MDNIKIPQDVQVADKLVGPFSMKQLILVGLGVGFSYTLFAIFKNASGAVPIVAHIFIWLPAVMAAAFALVRINNLSLWRLCLLLIEMLSKPRQRVWQSRQGLVINIQTRTAISRYEKREQKEREQAVAKQETASQAEGAKKESQEVQGVRAVEPPKTLGELSALLDQEGRNNHLIDTIAQQEVGTSVMLGERPQGLRESSRHAPRSVREKQRVAASLTVETLQSDIDSLHPPLT